MTNTLNSLLSKLVNSLSLGFFFFTGGFSLFFHLECILLSLLFVSLSIFVSLNWLVQLPFLVFRKGTCVRVSAVRTVCACLLCWADLSGSRLNHRLGGLRAYCTRATQWAGWSWHKNRSRSSGACHPEAALAGKLEGRGWGVLGALYQGSLGRLCRACMGMDGVPGCTVVGLPWGDSWSCWG